MRRAIATVSLSGTLRDKLEAIAAARFDAVELFEPDFIGFRGTAREARRIAEDLGLAIDLYQPLRDFEGMPEPLFRRGLDRAERKFDLMGELGTSMMLVCSNTSPASLGDRGLAAAQLHELAARASRRRIRIGFEALAWGRWVQRFGQAWAIVREAAHPHLGLILDSFHTLSLGDDPGPIRDIPGDRIFFLQMADAPRMSMDVLQWARHHRNFPGQGDFDLVSFLEHVLLAGYTGTLSLEIFNDVFRATPNRRTAVDAMRSLLFLESQLRNRLEANAVQVSDDGVARLEHSAGNESSAASPGATDEADRSRRVLGTLSLFDSPEPTALGGFAFLEFGVDVDTAGRLGAVLERMGFTVLGRHRSKAVTLYRQGTILLVLNAVPGSDARTRFDTQGASISCLGVFADDPARAAERASALLSARRDSPRGAQELQLPAIVAPGGTIVQFVPRGQSVEADFVASTVDVPNASCGLTIVDHIAMGLAIEQFDTWVLFARAVLGLSRGESLDLADPFGLIRSCGVADRDRRLRIVLNVSLSDRTRTARQVSAAGPAGGGVHHIALGCSDIFETVATLRSRGVAFVSISPNYYDDLAARTALDEDVLAKMRALDIVFDAVGEGTYLHAYTDAFEGRFFFEVVQRHGYDGYGAINAPARMASVEQRP